MHCDPANSKMAEATLPERKYNVLVYGLERKGLPVPSEPLKGRNFSIFFEKYGTSRRFQEYDGVVIFQGIFEKFENITNNTSSYLKHNYDVNELDKRKKETKLLHEKSGFICFLLTDFFIDSDNGRDFHGTDLAKFHLNFPNFHRKNFTNRVAHVTPVQDEFKRFLDVFGAASTFFNNYNNTINLKILAKAGNLNVGILLDQITYFLPSLIPDARADVITEYFEHLVDGITSVHNKLDQIIPEWVDTFKFTEEETLLEERALLISNVLKIDQSLEKFKKYKASLVNSGSGLVTIVNEILSVTLGMKTDMVDDFREDIKILDADGNAICLCEIKGINKGVTRESINQTDSHRERSGFDSSFPVLFIANTNIKSARNMAEKAQDIAVEQIKHAVHMRVLVMRSIDLLGLLRLVLAKKLTNEQARELVFSNVGWLKVESDVPQLVNGN